MDANKVYNFTPVWLREKKRQLTLGGEWKVAVADRPWLENFRYLDSLDWFSVKLPDGLQDALFFAGKINNPWQGRNWREAAWVFRTDWWFRKKFTVPAAWKGKMVRLFFDNLDYYGRVWLNGKYLGFHEGAYGGPLFDVTGLIRFGGENELLVRAGQCRDERENSPIYKPTALRSGPPAWNNRNSSVGLWNSVRLVATEKSFLECPYVATEEIGKDHAVCWVQSMVHNQGKEYHGRVTLKIREWPDGKEVFSETFEQKVPTGVSMLERRIRVGNPRLWWPVGLGEPALYTAALTLDDAGSKDRLDEIAVRFGIRKLEMVRNPVHPEKPRILNAPLTFTQSADGVGEVWRGMAAENQLTAEKKGFVNPFMRSLVSDMADTQADRNYRFLFRVNGKEFYANGASWWPASETMSYRPDRTRWLLRLAKESNLRLLRLNGGTTPFETELFYNQCDESGILVWQECIAGSPPPFDKDLDVWREQLTQNIYRLRNHPSLALWVFGNELDPYDKKMLPYVGLSRELCSHLDPEREFRPASPCGGARHGYNAYLAEEPWTLRLFGKDCNFVSEWGSPAMMSEASYRKVIDEKELNDRPAGYDWAKFLNGHPDILDRFAESYSVNPEILFRKAALYGDLNKTPVKKLTEYSQMGQALTYGYLSENWRALFPYHGGETVWNFNQMSPGSCWQTVDFFGLPNIAYYFRKRAYAPYHVLARMPYFSWAAGETFTAEVIAVSEGQRDGLTMSVRLLDRSFAEMETWSYPVSFTGGGMVGESREIKYKIPGNTPDSYFFLELSLFGKDRELLSRNCYWPRVTSRLKDKAFRTKYRSTVQPILILEKGPWLEPQLKKMPTTLEAECLKKTQAGGEIEIVVRVTNKGKRPAFPVSLNLVQPDTCCLCSDNYFWLKPGEKKDIHVSFPADQDKINPWFPVKKTAKGKIKITVSAWNAGITEHCLSW